MKIILMEDVEKLGVKGDVVSVKPGYFHNYLYPRDLAVQATPQQLKNLEQQLAKREEQQAAAREEAEKIAAQLKELKVVLEVKVGDAGRLFGTVTNKEIAEQLKAAHQVDVERRKIVLEDRIKEVGTYTLPVKLHPDVQAEVTVDVVPENA